jgi:hypothetical protein
MTTTTHIPMHAALDRGRAEPVPESDASMADRTVGLGALAAAGGFLAGCITVAVCLLPLLAIGLGVGGLGWLTQYLYLRVPAALAAAALLLLGYALVYRRGSQCARAGRRRAAKLILWVSAVFAIGINAFDFVLLPAVG